MSRFREPVIGDELDLETYGRPTSRQAAVQQPAWEQAAPRVRAHDASAERSAARARRFNSHRPRPAERAERSSSIDGRSSIDAQGVRTVKISGQSTPARQRSSAQRSSAQRSLAVQIDRYDRRPDRAAQWALFMGVFMVVVAIVTGT